MKKQIVIELTGEWVLEHRDDDVLPISVIKEGLQDITGIEFMNDSLTGIEVVFDAEKTDEKAVCERIAGILTAKYDIPAIDEVLSLTVAEFAPQQEAAPAKEAAEESAVAAAPATAAAPVPVLRPAASVFGAAPPTAESVMASIEELIGVSEFKALAREIVRIAPEIKSRELFPIFLNQNYLFAIGEGSGLSTYLELFGKLISACGLVSMSTRPVIELKLGEYKESLEPFQDVLRVLDTGDRKKVRILCVDISEWINKTDNRFFKQFLKLLDKAAEQFIVVFRVPFLDKDIIEKLRYSLSDLICIRTVAFPPLNRTEIKSCAEKEIGRYGFRVSRPAWEYFQQRISEEKRDGKFYGLNTIKKVARELIYKKLVNNSFSKKSSDLITRADMKELCDYVGEDSLTGMEQLCRLVGHEKIKDRIEEILAQIELSVKDRSSDRPCIHMRFVGNPGTGKTTVARIIGKILKERGVLRVGGFFEYAGRDFCGRYVGETAPKTASICRDAYGSVLFIDEAYSLYRGQGSDVDYGKEALDTLIAEMENHRNDFVVIMAGYTDEMNTLMEGNHGLASRMPYTIEFPNFTGEQLYEIFVSMVGSKFKHDEFLLDTAHAYFTSLSDEVLNSKEFSNARFVRNLFERTWAKAAMRSQLGDKTEIVLTKDDFERASSEKDFALNLRKKTVLGF